MSLIENGNGEAKGLGRVLRALRYRNYRLFFAGQGISLIGTWMQFTALPWLLYHNLHATPKILGDIGFAGQIPGFLLMAIGGVVADRLNRRRIIIVTQILAMLQAFALAALVLTNVIQIWHVLLLSIFMGLVNSFDMPARQSFVVDMTEDRAVLPNAIALNSSMFNGARVIGPAIGGVVVAAVGAGMCFLLNGISFIAVILSLIAMKIPNHPSHHEPSPVWARLKEGFHYAIGFSPIRHMLMLLMLISLMGMPYTVLMPFFAGHILHGNAKTYGLLMASPGIGALIGALFLASRRSVVGLGKWIPLAAMIFGTGITAFALSKIIWFSCIMLVFAGFGMIMQMGSSNTIIQTVVDEDKRGRVMSIYTMAFLGAAPVGSLLAGRVATSIGPSLTVVIGGVCCIIGAGLFAIKLPELRDHIHPIYVKLGIVPETTAGEVAVPVEDNSEN